LSLTTENDRFYEVLEWPMVAVRIGDDCRRNARRTGILRACPAGGGLLFKSELAIVERGKKS